MMTVMINGKKHHRNKQQTIFDTSVPRAKPDQIFDRILNNNEL